MALPKRRQSRARGRKRRSHAALRTAGQTHCPHCNAAKLPHRVCPNCGYYRGKAVIATEND